MSFNTVGGLLTWAFETVASPAGQRSSLGAVDGSGGRGSASVLSPLEHRAMATQIVGWVTNMPISERLVLLGLFNGAMSKPTVAYSLVGAVPAGFGIPAAMLAIERWLDSSGNITQQMLADRMKKSVPTAKRYFRDVANELDALLRQANQRVRRQYADLLSDEQTERDSEMDLTLAMIQWQPKKAKLHCCV